ncbi:MAG TPA: SCO family protein [Phycisphaerales bacterium]|nr:SCO family protein [Phycisphaerales bacterium]
MMFRSPATSIARTLAMASVAVASLSCVAGASAQSLNKGYEPNPAPPAVPFEERGVGVEERVGLSLPLDLQMIDQDGQTIELKKYFPGDGKPVLLMLVYYRCPIVCDVFREKMFQTLSQVDAKGDYQMGKDYRVVVVSFDPTEIPETAKGVRELDIRDAYVRALPEGALAGVNYHVAEGSAARTLADSLGFQYKRLDNNEYSHPVVGFVATPDGKISRYLYGYPSALDPDTVRNYKLALMEASEGKMVRSVGERIMMFCYEFDPTRGTYTLQAFRVMQIGGGITIVLVASLIGGLLLTERIRRRRQQVQATDPSPPTTSAPAH